MREKIVRFLIELSKDPLKRDAFQENPEAVLESEGLTDEEARKVLGGGDPDSIRRYLEDEEAAAIMVNVLPE